MRAKGVYMSKKNTDDKKMSKAKYALNIALVVIQVAIVVVAIAFSISILLSTGYDSATDFGDSAIRLMPVLTDSMNGDKDDSFAAGDLIIVKKADKDKIAALEEGDIITYLEDIGTQDVQFVTHRIVSIEETASGEKIYYTMGDAETSGITKAVLAGDIQGIYVAKLAGVGNAVFWLQDPTHFFLVIMLPLILLLLYNAYLVVRIIIESKLKKQREQLVAATASGNTPLDEEEIKRRAIEEYLLSQNAQTESAGGVGVVSEPANGTENAPETAVSAEPERAEGEPVPAEGDVSAQEEPEQGSENIKEDVGAEESSGTTPEEPQVADPVTVETASVEEPAPAEETSPSEEISEATENNSAPDAENAEASEEKAEEKPAEPVKKPAVKKTSTTGKTAAKKTAAADKTATKKTVKKTTATDKTGEKKTAKKTANKSAEATAAAGKKTAAKKAEAKPAAGKSATSAAKAKSGTGKKGKTSE